MVMVDHPLDAVSKDHDVEVDQQADGNFKQTEIGEELSVVNRMQRVFAFGLDHDSVIHYEVGPKSTIKLNVVIDEWYYLLTLNSHTQFLEFVSEAGLVGRFQQPWSQLSMDFYSSTNDFAGEVGASQEQKLTAKFAKDSAKAAKKGKRTPKTGFAIDFLCVLCGILGELCG